LSERVSRSVPTSASPGRYSRHWLPSAALRTSLGESCSLVASSRLPTRLCREPSASYPVPCVHWFVTLGRCFTPGLVLSERMTGMCLPCQRPVSFWVQPVSQRWGCFSLTACPERSRRDAYAPSLAGDPLGAIVTCLARSSCLTQSLSPFSPAAGPELAEGLITSRTPGDSAFTSSTRRVGFVVTSTHRHEHSVTKRH
jgi:hypothetical protein